MNIAFYNQVDFNDFYFYYFLIINRYDFKFYLNNIDCFNNNNLSLKFFYFY